MALITTSIAQTLAETRMPPATMMITASHANQIITGPCLPIWAKPRTRIDRLSHIGAFSGGKDGVTMRELRFERAFVRHALVMPEDGYSFGNRRVFPL
jgi:hypothetical protein